MKRVCIYCASTFGCYSNGEKINCGGSFCTGICPPEGEHASHGICDSCIKKHNIGGKHENLCVLQPQNG